LVGSHLTPLSKSLATDGFVKVPGFVDSNFVHNILNSINLAAQVRSSPFFRDLSLDQTESFLSDIWSSHFVRDFTASYIPSSLPSLMSSLMNCPSLILLQDTWFKRTTSCTTPIPWHHDQSIEGPFYSTWISLTDIPAASSLHFARGSHKSGLRYLPSSFFDTDSCVDELSAMESFYRSFHYSSSTDYTDHFCPVPSDIESNSDYDIVALPSAIGDLIIFNGLTLHSLPSSFTNSCGFVLRWVSAESVVSPYSKDAQIASDYLDVSLRSGEPITDDFFLRFNF